ncbi:MAG: NAD-binding protein [Halobacteriales archaeon]
MKPDVVVVGDEVEAHVERLRDAGYDVSVSEGGTDALVDAGVDRADAVVVVGREHAVQVVVARDVNPALRTVLVAEGAPDYVRGSVDVVLSSGVEDRVVDAVSTEEA